ncbi:MAG: hypothetical protein HC828_05070 [Blastochloris sp.]|nr:hypothetical protein [Blastochloris sp.]
MHIQVYRTLAVGVLAVWMAVMMPLSTMAHPHTTDARLSTSATSVSAWLADAECRGETKIETEVETPYVWEVTDVYLDSCLTEAVTATALGGGGFAELCGLLVAAAGPGFCVAVDPILFIGADTIQNVNNVGGQGVILRVFTPPRLTPTVWPQGLSPALSDLAAP